jgi:soluble lytic murein transglycosylase
MLHQLGSSPRVGCALSRGRTPGIRQLLSDRNAMPLMIRAHAAMAMLFAGAVLLDAPPAYSAGTDEKRSAARAAPGKPEARSRTRKQAAKRPSAARVPMPRARPRAAAAGPDERSLLLLASADAHAPVGAAVGAADRALLEEAIAAARAGKVDAATALKARIRDAAGRTLVEWALLRADDAPAPFARYAAFLAEHPSWPDARRFRLRAEAKLWSEKAAPATVLRFFAGQEPAGVLGRLALARAALARGDAAQARRQVRAAWRTGAFSAALEAQVLEDFGSMLGEEDHRARMRARLFDDDIGAALRAARRVGPAAVAIVEARAAVKRGGKDADAKLAAVPHAARGDDAYLFTSAQWLRRKDRVTEAARTMLAAQPRADEVDADAWWMEARTLVRDLLDAGHARTAYRVAAAAPLPAKESLRVDQPFTAGWIALRFLGDADTAARHFGRIPQLTDHPTSLARAGYWLGRAAEAAGRRTDARGHYAAAARHSAAYYGQLARARLGEDAVPVRRPDALGRAERAALRQVEVVRALELLYAVGQNDLVIPLLSDLESVRDAGVLTALAEIAGARKDARAMVQIGRQGLARGFDFDLYAFPATGLPKYTPLGRTAPASLVYAIARAESAFSATAVSHARAQGLMQVMPATGRTIARRLGIKFDARRLRNDPAYNVQLGSAEIAHLVHNYDGNHVLAFVGYNAGPGRVKQWVARYGDPRDSSVDAVDWVERIPFTETRIYVQRVLENLQVYRARFEDGARGTIEADMRGGRTREASRPDA